jgi:hypothetical protein
MVELFANNELGRTTNIAAFIQHGHPSGFYTVYCSVLVQEDALDCTAASSCNNAYTLKTEAVMLPCNIGTFNPYLW